MNRVEQQGKVKCGQGKTGREGKVQKQSKRETKAKY